MLKKINTLNDIFFRYLLGDEHNVDLCLSFINAINLESGFPMIKEVIIKNPINLRNCKIGKETFLDIKALGDDKKVYNIEVQISGNEYFPSRSLYYWSKLYSAQLKKRQTYESLNPVICINLLAFTLFDDFQDPYSYYMLTNQKYKDLVLSEHIVMHFIELPKFKLETNLKTPLDQWLGFLKYEGEREDIMKILLKDNKDIKKAHEEYKKFTKNEALLALYTQREIVERDQLTAIAVAEKKGKIEIAEKMIDKNISDEDIHDITGLSIEKIKEIRKNKSNKKIISEKGVTPKKKNYKRTK